MNTAAEQSTKASSKGVAKCKQTTDWFGLIVLLTDDKGKTTDLANITAGLKIPDLGEIEKVTPGAAKPVLVPQLAPGGKGDVLQMKHGTGVYEAVGDFY